MTKHIENVVPANDIVGKTIKSAAYRVVDTWPEFRIEFTDGTVTTIRETGQAGSIEVETMYGVPEWVDFPAAPTLPWWLTQHPGKASVVATDENRDEYARSLDDASLRRCFEHEAKMGRMELARALERELQRRGS